jgi:tetratricopeptide (TPR) repeat protein
VHQRAKGPIDPSLGARVRELRLARGMTQADLAGSDFTKGFISLVETARTRVSVRAAQILAARLGTTAAELLATMPAEGRELELLILRGEQMVAGGNPAEAIELLRRAAGEGSGLIRARAQRSLGRALVDAGKPREGLAALEDAGRAFETLGQRDLQIRTLYDRAVAHAHLDEPGNALTLALESESAMRAGGLVDKTLELQLRSFLAAVFARAGDLDSAEVQAQQALRLAEHVVDQEALATLYSTLSVTRQRQHELDEALKYARQSLALFEHIGRDRAIGQLWHNVAAIHIQRGTVGEAERALDRAEKIAKASRIGSLEARVLGLRAEIAAAQRRWKSADEFAAAVVTHPAASATTRGKGLLVRFRALAARKAPLRALRTLIDEASKLLAGEPAASRAEVHDTFARVLADRGDWKTAYEEARHAVDLLQPRLK